MPAQIDVLPAQTLDLAPAQTRVERHCVGHGVVGTQGDKQPLGLGYRGHTRPRLLIPRWQFDKPDRVARHEPACRSRRPAVDGACHRKQVCDPRTRQAAVTEPVDPPLPLELRDVLRDPRAELRYQDAVEVTAVPAQRRLRVRIARAPTLADRASFHAIPPAPSDLGEGHRRMKRARLGRAHDGSGAPRERLAAVARRPRPLRLAGHDVPLAHAPGRLTTAPRTLFGSGRAPASVPDVHPGNTGRAKAGP
jgi:hypothetical protein